MKDSPSIPSSPDGDPLSDLLGNVEWLRQLARRLARNDAEAEDMAQRTWLAALRGPSTERGGATRPWLAQVLRNEARMERRASRRRLDREAVVAAEARENAPSTPDQQTSEVEERFRLQRQLMDAVAGLDEPYRSCIMGAYFEGLTTAALAARDGVSPRTVESRLRRGREALRQRLDAQFGSRESWCMLAVPLLPHGAATAPGAASPSTTPSLVPETLKVGALVMTIKSVCIGAAALLALVLTWQLSQDVEPLSDGGAVLASQDTEVATDLESPMLAAEAPATRVAKYVDFEEPPRDDKSDAQENAVPEETTVRARVLDAEGNACVGEWVRLDPPLGTSLDPVDRFRTGANGEFEFQAVLPESFRSSLIPESDAWTTVMSRPISPGVIKGNMAALLAVAPSTLLQAEVTDEDGEPIEGAEAKLTLPEGFRFRFNDTLNMSRESEWSATSNVHGAFVVESAPRVDGCLLEVSAQGFRGTTVMSPAALRPGGSTSPLVIVLERLSREDSVEGVVLGPNGSPVEGARVGLGQACRTTRGDGTFSFHLKGEDVDANGAQRLVAAAKGLTSAEFVPDKTDGEPDWPDYVELRLENSALEIEGIVLGRAGQPLAQAKVWIEDPTFVGVEGHQVIVAEGLGGEGPRLWQEYTADATGRFTIKGLSARAYSVRAMDPQTLLLSESVSIEAGVTDARIQLSQDTEVANLEGIVRNASGEPLAGAELSCHRWAFLYRVPGDSGARAEKAETGTVRTGNDGRFRMESVPISDGHTLQVLSDHYSLLKVEVKDLQGPLDRLEITLYRDCQARIVDRSEETERADSAAAVDAAGDPLTMTYLSSNNSASLGQSVPITDGNSPTFWISDAARSIVFSLNGEPIHTMPIDLVPGEVNELVRQ